MFVALALALIPQATPTLGELAQDGAPIVLATVVKMHRVADGDEAIGGNATPWSTLQLAECRIERVLLGDPTTTRLYVATRAASGEWFDLHPSERFVLFAGWGSTSFRPTTGESKRAQQVTARAEVLAPLVGGIWQVEGKRGFEVVRPPTTSGPLPQTIVQKDGVVSLPVFLEWVEREALQSAPTIQAFRWWPEAWVSGRPSSWGFRVRPDGSWSAISGDTVRGVLEPAAWKSLRGLIDHQEMVGDDKHAVQFGGIGVCTSGLDVWLRRRDGVFKITYGAMEGFADTARTPAHANALRIFDALPLESAPPFRPWRP